MINKEELMYGEGNEERLIHTDPMEIVRNRIDDFCENAGESFNLIADRITWPIKVHEYRREKLEVDHISGFVLENLLEHLDENYGDHDGDYTEPTDKMKEAASAFAEVIVAEYVPWVCVPTGKVIEITRQQAMEELDTANR